MGMMSVSTSPTIIDDHVHPVIVHHWQGCVVTLAMLGTISIGYAVSIGRAQL
jgi:hypothetical protein